MAVDDAYIFDSNTSNFMTVIEQRQTEMKTATDFPSNINKHLNPNVGEVDQMIAFPISSHCETMHEGMQMVYAAMLANNFRMFTVEDNGTTAILPNAK